MIPRELKLFQAAAIAEAISWAGLLIGMYFKYLGGGNEIGVKIFGPVHGVLFMVYIVTVLYIARKYDRGLKELFIGLVCAVPPFFTLYYDRRVMKWWRSKEKAPANAAG
ncbi:DUF3817 domain-containing protein [Salininema proteolyticum]|uniref:DUF3817 domain-containing protein n=1 Tax=Salininema proteolyticum TaxID=1607685 RepID=A0ABV8U1U2_9ACTN